MRWQVMEKLISFLEEKLDTQWTGLWVGGEGRCSLASSNGNVGFGCEKEKSFDMMLGMVCISIVYCISIVQKYDLS